jgi:hypothetical protein
MVIGRKACASVEYVLVYGLLTPFTLKNRPPPTASPASIKLVKFS